MGAGCAAPACFAGSGRRRHASTPPVPGLARIGPGASRSRGRIKRPASFLGKLDQMSCHRFAANAVRLRLHALVYNLAHLLRTFALPDEVKLWSLITLRAPHNCSAFTGRDVARRAERCLSFAVCRRNWRSSGIVGWEQGK